MFLVSNKDICDTSPRSKVSNSFMLEVLSYINQTMDIVCKSIDWFLYNRDLCQEKVESLPSTKNYIVERYTRLNSVKVVPAI